MVSKGWRSVLAQSDARAEARLVLRPSTASDEDDDADDEAGDLPPPRLMAVDNSSADERRLCPFHLAVTPSTSALCGNAGPMLLLSAAEALPTRHNARQIRTLCRNGVIIVVNQFGASVATVTQGPAMHSTMTCQRYKMRPTRRRFKTSGRTADRHANGALIALHFSRS